MPGSGFELSDTYFRIGFGSDPAELHRAQSAHRGVQGADPFEDGQRCAESFSRPRSPLSAAFLRWCQRRSHFDSLAAGADSTGPRNTLGMEVWDGCPGAAAGCPVVPVQVPLLGRPAEAWREDRVRLVMAIAGGVKTEEATAQARMSRPWCSGGSATLTV